MGTKIIEFVKSSPPYQVGEIAGFPEQVAKERIASGVAIAHKPRVRKTLKKVMTPEAKEGGYKTKAE